MAITINEGTQTNVASDLVGAVEYPVMKMDVGAAGASSLFTGTIGAVTNLAGGTITKIEGGTVAEVTLVKTAGTLSAGDNNVGNVDIISGTQQTLGTVGVVNNLVTGTIAAVTSVANLAAGTVSIVTNGTITPYKNPSGSVTLTTHTLGTAAGTTWGTLIAPVGAGTYVYVQGISIVARSGTPDCAITTNVAGSTGAGVFTRGAFVPSGGIARDFNSPIQVGTNGTIAYMILNGTADFTVNYWIGT